MTMRDRILSILWGAAGPVGFWELFYALGLQSTSDMHELIDTLQHLGQDGKVVIGELGNSVDRSTNA